MMKALDSIPDLVVLEIVRSLFASENRRTSMRQVGEAELVWNLKLAVSRLSTTQRNDLKSAQREVRKRAEQSVAAKLAEQLKRYEILSEAPLPESSDLFSRAAFGTSDQPMIGRAEE